MAEHSAESAVSFVDSEETCRKLQSGGSGPRGGSTSGRGRSAGASGSRGSRGGKSNSHSNSRSTYRSRWGDLEGEALKEALTEAGVCFKCGNDHAGQECKYSHAVCTKCGKEGHISPVCFGARKVQNGNEKRGTKRGRNDDEGSQPAPNQPRPSGSEN